MKYNRPTFSRLFRLGTLLAALSALLFLAGCDILLPAGPALPTATATTTLTPTPTIDWFPATPTPTLQPTDAPTPMPTLEDVREGVTELVVSDDFSDTSAWTLPHSTAGNVAYGNNNLALAAAQNGAYLFSESPYTLSSDFYLEFTVETSLCQGDDQYGVVFWQQSEGDFYRLLLTCEGSYRLEVAQGGSTIVIHNWEVASRFRPNAPASNRFGLWVRNGAFQLYINDTYQFEESIARDRSGDLGIFARTISGSALTVRFSDLQIYRVGEE
jgi:hypothetical protein